MKKNANQQEGGNLESMLSELEALVGDLEQGNLSLDESLKRFEIGIEKFKSCKKLIAQAEKKITLLTESLSNSMEEIDYDMQDEKNED